MYPSPPAFDFSSALWSCSWTCTWHDWGSRDSLLYNHRFMYCNFGPQHYWLNSWKTKHMQFCTGIAVVQVKSETFHECVWLAQTRMDKHIQVPLGPVNENYKVNSEAVSITVVVLVRSKIFYFFHIQTQLDPFEVSDLKRLNFNLKILDDIKE